MSHNFIPDIRRTVRVGRDRHDPAFVDHVNHIGARRLKGLQGLVISGGDQRGPFFRGQCIILNLRRIFLVVEECVIIPVSLFYVLRIR